MSMKPNQFKVIILSIIAPVVIWLNVQQETINSPMERFNNILGNLTAVSVFLDTIYKEDSEDSDPENK